MAKVSRVLVIGVFFFFNSFVFAEAKIEPLYSAVVKGGVLDYYPSLFSNFRLLEVRAFVHNMWAGKLYLTKNHKDQNMAVATQEFYQEAVKSVQDYAIGYCSGYMGTKGYKAGYAFADHLEVAPVYDEGMATYLISANVMCFAPK